MNGKYVEKYGVKASVWEVKEAVSDPFIQCVPYKEGEFKGRTMCPFG